VYEVIEFKKVNESPEEWDYISDRLELIYTTYRSIHWYKHLLSSPSRSGAAAVLSKSSLAGGMIKCGGTNLGWEEMS
jgi:hypothetical protein